MRANWVRRLFAPTRPIRRSDTRLAAERLEDRITPTGDALVVAYKDYLLDGLDRYLEELQEDLDVNAFGATFLPIIGDDLADSFTLTEEFRTPLLQELEARYPTTEPGAVEAVRGILFDVLGPNQLNLLRDQSGDGEITIADIVFDSSPSSVGYSMRLGRDWTPAAIDPNFDIGLDSLELKLDARVQLDTSWEMPLAFRITPNADPRASFSVDVSAGVDLTVDLMASIPNFDAFGTFGPLEVRVTEQEGNSTIAGFTLTIDIYDRSGDNQFTPLTGERIDVDTKITGGATLNLHIDVSPFGGNRALPSFLFDLNMGINATAVSPTAGSRVMPGDFKYLEFNNISIDVGSYLHDVIKPLAEQIYPYVKPLDFLLDRDGGFLYEPLPIYSDLTGDPSTPLQLLRQTGDLRVILATMVVEQIAGVQQLIREVDSGSERAIVNMGGFRYQDLLKLKSDANHKTQAVEVTGEKEGGNSLPDDLRANLDSYRQKRNIREPNSILDAPGVYKDVNATPEAKVAKALATNAGAAITQFKEFMDQYSTTRIDQTSEQQVGWSYPMLSDPNQIIRLILGQYENVELVRYDVDVIFDYRLDVDPFRVFDVAQDIADAINIPVDLPDIGDFVTATLVGGIGLRIDLAAGSDLSGLARYAQTGNRNDLLNGFFIEADGGNGIWFEASVEARGGVDVGILDVSIGGGITGDIGLQVWDPRGDDGKVRYEEIRTFYDPSGSIPNTSKNALTLFTVGGGIEFDFDAEWEVGVDGLSWSGSYDYDGGFFFDFDGRDKPPQPSTTPRLATLQEDGTLVINVGAYAAGRIFGELSDGNDVVSITHVSGVAGNERVEISALGLTQRYSNARRIVVNLGEGDDEIIFDGVLSELDVAGGVGNDTIILGNTSGPTFVRGGAGDDIIIGSGRTVGFTADGGSGNDFIIGSFGNDVLLGGSGDDVIEGRAGNDIIRGGSGNDILYADGSGAATGAPGFDQLFGEIGDDQLFGGTGTSILDGGSGNDTLRDAPVDANGNPLLVSGTTEMRGGRGDDTLISTAGNDLLVGGSGNDVLRGGSGNDRLFGGSGDDILAGGGGNNQLYGEGGADRLLVSPAIAGTRNDVLDGGTGLDTFRFDNLETLTTVSTVTLAGNKLTATGGGTVNVTFTNLEAAEAELAFTVDSFTIDNPSVNDLKVIAHKPLGGGVTVGTITAVNVLGLTGTVLVNSSRTNNLSTVTVGRNGTLADIRGTLTVGETDLSGDLTPTLNTLLVIDAGNTTGDLSGSFVTSTGPNFVFQRDLVGLGLPGAIRTGLVSGVHVHLGSGRDTFTITDGPRFRIGTPALVSVYGNGGDDTFSLIRGSAHFDGGPGGVDRVGIIVSDTDSKGQVTTNEIESVFVDATGLTRDTVWYLDDATLKLDMADGTRTILANYRQDGLEVRFGSGNDTLTVGRVPNSVLFNLGAGNDTVILDSGGNRVSGINDQLTLRGEAGTDTLIVNDAANPAAATYSLAAASVVPAPVPESVVSGSTIGVAVRAEVEAVEFRTGTGNDTFSTDATTAALTVTSAGGQDTITVAEARHPTTITAAAGGLDARVGLLSAPVAVTGTGMNSRLVIGSKSFTGNQTVTANGSQISGLQGQLVNFTGITDLLIQLGQGTDTLSLTGTSAALTTIDSGSRPDVISVGQGLGTVVVQGNGSAIADLTLSGNPSAQAFPFGNLVLQEVPTVRVTSLGYSGSTAWAVTPGGDLTADGTPIVTIPSTGRLELAAGAGSDTLTVSGAEDRPHTVTVSPNSVLMTGPPAAATIFEQFYAAGGLTHDALVNGVSNGQAVAVSPDGNFVYVAAGDDVGLAVFRRDPASGTLRPFQYLNLATGGLVLTAGLVNPTDLVVSNDGKFVYLTGIDGAAVGTSGAGVLAVFTVNADGRLSLRQAFRPSDAQSAASAFYFAGELAVSGGTLFGRSSDELWVFDRDAGTGLISFRQLATVGNGAGLAVSRDGSRVFVPAGGNLEIYPVTAGTVGVGTTIAGPGGTYDAVAAGPTSDLFYATRTRPISGITLLLDVWKRDSSSGVWSVVQTFANTAIETGAIGLTALGVRFGNSATAGLALSSDATRLVVATGSVGVESRAVIFNVNLDGTLGTTAAAVEQVVQGTGGVTGLEGAQDLAFSPDGTRFYTVSQTGSFPNFGGALATYRFDSGSGNWVETQALDDGDTVPTSPLGFDSHTRGRTTANGDVIYAVDQQNAAIVVIAANGSLTDPLTGIHQVISSRDGIPQLEGVTSVHTTEADLNGSPFDPSGQVVIALNRGRGSILLFARNPVDGTLTFADEVTVTGGLTDAVVTLEPVFKQRVFVYVTSTDGTSGTSRLRAFEVVSGQLVEVGNYRDGLNGVDGLNGASSVAYFSDLNGAIVLAAGALDNSVAVFRQESDGTLTYLRHYRDGVDGVDGLAGASQIEPIGGGVPRLVVLGPDDRTVSAFTIDTQAGTLNLINRVVTPSFQPYLLANDSNAVFALDQSGALLTYYFDGPGNGTLSLAGVTRDGIPPLGIGGVPQGLSEAVSLAVVGRKPFTGSSTGATMPGLSQFDPTVFTITEVNVSFTGVETLNVITLAADDTVRIRGTTDGIPTTITLGGGADTLMIEGTAASGTVTINAGGGADKLLVLDTGSGGTVNLNAGDGKDEVTIRGTGGATVAVNTGNDADTIVVFGPGIAANGLTINGGSPTTSPGDVLRFNDNGLSLTQTGPTGGAGTLRAGSAGTVSYSGIESVQFDFPTRAVVGGPYSTTEGDGVTLAASGSSSLSGRPLTYSWDLNGDGVFGDAAGVTVTLTWAELVTFGITDDGVYPIAVRVADDLGNVDGAETTLTVANRAPTVAISGPASAVEGGTYTLTLSSSDPGDDTIESWVINWGDGTIETIAGNPATATHVYADESAGRTISAAALDEDGSHTAAGTVVVVVAGAAPTATVSQASASIREAEGLTVALTGAQDASAVDAAAGLRYSFALSSAGLAGAYGDAEAYSTARFDFPDSGTYTVFARVIDKDGLFTDYAVPVTVANVVPTAAVGNSGPVDAGTAATVFFIAPTDPSPTDLAGVRYSFDFGDDGTFEVIDAVSPVAEVPAALVTEPGTVIIRGRVSDPDGGSTEYLTTLVVRPVAPAVRAGLPAGGSAVSVPEGGSLTVSLVTDREGTDPIIEWVIDWGDGTVETVPGTSTSADHTYDGAGTYTVTIVAVTEDDAGNTTAIPAGSVTVTVFDTAPVLTLAAGTTSVQEGDTFTLDLAATDVGPLTVRGWVIEWGDGTVQTIDGTPESVSYVYPDGGARYVVRASAIDANGTFPAVNTIIVDVLNVDPTLSLLGDPTITEGSSYTLSLGSIDPGRDTLAWIVHWGDGEVTVLPAGAVTAEHVYGTGGQTHIITATAVDEDGTYAAGNSVTVTVTDVPASVTAIGPAEATEGIAFAVQLGTTDVGINQVTGYSINWGDRTIEQVDPDVKQVVHKYPDGPATYTVTVTAIDAGQNVSAAPFVISVLNATPTAEPVAVAGPGLAGVNLTFTGQFADTGDDTLTVTWDFGDGTVLQFPAATDAAATVVHSFASPGTYTVTRTVTDSDGAEAFTSLDVTVSAFQTFTPAPVPEGSVLTVRWETGAGTTTGWKVAWGDGTVTTHSAEARSATHVYADNGSYPVRVSAIVDATAFPAATAVQAVVRNVAPTAVFQVPPVLRARVAATVVFDSVFDPGVADRKAGLVYSLDTDGDGLFETVSTSPTLEVSYDRPGTYTLRGQVSDKDGGVSQFTTTVTVMAATPGWFAVAVPDTPRVVAVETKERSIRTDATPFPNFTGLVRATVGDVTGDGVPDLITSVGSNGGPHVKVFDGVSGAEIASFFSYSESFTGGVWVAVADVTGDGVAEIITGAGIGGGPHVKVFDSSGAELASFMAYSDSLRDGVSVAAADVTGDGIAEIITGPGTGGAPHVRVYAWSGSIVSELFGFYAGDTNSRAGMTVAAADLDGDGIAEIITASGAGEPPIIRTHRWTDGTVLGESVGLDPNIFNGPNLAVVDVLGNGRATVLVGSPSGRALRAFNGVGLNPVDPAALLPDELNGVFVG